MKKIIVLLVTFLSATSFAMTTTVKENNVVMVAPTIQTTTTSAVTETFRMGPYSDASFQCAWSSVTGTQPQYKLQVTNNDSNWEDVTGATTITTGSSGSETYVIQPVSFYGARINVTTASTTGNLSCTSVARGQK